jgi:hypothetical protein
MSYAFRKVPGEIKVIMARNPNEVLITISIQAKTQDGLDISNEVLQAIREMPKYAADDGEMDKDTRRGGYTMRYETFVFHKQ